MACDLGYGELENKLIGVFGSGIPDFDAAEALIRQGADVNALGEYDKDNILSEILYYWSQHCNSNRSLCNDCKDCRCYDCQHKDPRAGPLMCAAIRFFLDHGFDVNKRDGCFGAQCLYALTLSSFDRYMIEATKLLLDAGAKDRTISPASTDEYETPWSAVISEGTYKRVREHDHSAANIFEAIDRIYQAAEEGKPYSGIDSYEMAIGKKILKVLAEAGGAGPVFFSMDLPEFKKENCYTQTLYFVYDGGMLISNRYADFWTDTVLPPADLVDVSSHFDGIVGSTVKGFSYDHRSVAKGTMQYGQPITTMEMDSGRKVRFSINFGEVKKEDLAAFYELIG